MGICVNCRPTSSSSSIFLSSSFILLLRFLLLFLLCPLVVVVFLLLMPVTSQTTWDHLKCPYNYLDILSDYFLLYKLVA